MAFYFGPSTALQAIHRQRLEWDRKGYVLLLGNMISFAGKLLGVHELGAAFSGTVGSVVAFPDRGQWFL